MFWQLETERLLNEKEVAELFSVKVSTLRRWRWCGRGPSFLKLGGAVRYDPQELKNFLAASKRTSTSDLPETQASSVTGGGRVCSRDRVSPVRREREPSFMERALNGEFNPCT